jgi:hypothetical protein
MATELQFQANCKNAQLSTVAKSATGKAIVGSNRLSHGILSNNLLLDDECPEACQALLDDLQAQLKPVGALELALVEKIAITLWRQQRLVRAETAVISLEANPRRIAHEVGIGMGLPGSIETHDMGAPDPEHVEWCKAVISELDDVASLNIGNLKDAAPLTFACLESDADEEGESIEERLAGKSLRDYVYGLRGSCFGELHRSEQHPAMVEMANAAKDKLTIAWSKLQTLSAYESTLDRSLCKAIKALREAQQWRADVVSSNDIFEVG